MPKLAGVRHRPRLHSLPRTKLILSVRVSSLFSRCCRNSICFGSPEAGSAQGLERIERDDETPNEFAFRPSAALSQQNKTPRPTISHESSMRKERTRSIGRRRAAVSPGLATHVNAQQPYPGLAYTLNGSCRCACWMRARFQTIRANRQPQYQPQAPAISGQHVPQQP